MSDLPPVESGDDFVAAAASDQQQQQPLSLTQRIHDAYKSEQWWQVLMFYEQLAERPDVKSDEDLKEVTRAWGRAILAAKHTKSDEEHLEEMVQEFESQFEPSPYLRALLTRSDDPAAAIEEVVDLTTGTLAAEAVEGVLDRFKSLTTEELRRVLKALRDHKFIISGDVSERIQKHFVLRMKNEDPEAVFREMTEAGLKPTQPNAFNFLFMKHNLTMNPMALYEQMIDLGIKPHLSTYRILMKHPGLSKEDCAIMRRRAKGDTNPDERYMQAIRMMQQDNNIAGAERMYKRMLLEDIIPDKYVFNYIIMCCHGAPQESLKWYEEMKKRNVLPNTVTFTNLMLVWRHTDKFAEMAEFWVEEMKKRGLKMESHNHAVVVEALIGAGRQKSQKYFAELLASSEEIDIGIFNNMIKLGPLDWGLGILACIVACGAQPSHKTRNAIQALHKDATGQEIVDNLNRCGWDRVNILKNAQLVSPPKGSTPSMLECMKLMMRELRVPEDVATQWSYRFQNEVEAAKRLPPPPL